jgi:hypothetical protein
LVKLACTATCHAGTRRRACSCAPARDAPPRRPGPRARPEAAHPEASHLPKATCPEDAPSSRRLGAHARGVSSAALAAPGSARAARVPPGLYPWPALPSPSYSP